MSLHTKPRWWHPMLKSVASTRVGTWINRYVLPPVDRLVMRATGGRINLAGLATGLPVIVLTTTGAKSGKQRTTPLIAIPDGRKLALIATNWGQKRNPSWYYNLRAHPQAFVTVEGQTRAYTAREASPKEYDKYWRLAVHLYAGYENYQVWSGDRKIHIMVLSPVDVTAPA